MNAELIRFDSPALGAIWNTSQVQGTVVGHITLEHQESKSSNITFHYTLNSISDVLRLVLF